MNRMGHSSARAAMVYLHARDERDQQLAANLDRMVRRELKRTRVKATETQSGTQRARGAGKPTGDGPADHAGKHT
jgi:hypothetical protein